VTKRIAVTELHWLHITSNIHDTYTQRERTWYDVLWT